MKYYCDEYRHLVCEPYSIENLHAMAEDLGIKKWWFHKSKGGLCHYDIPKKRVEEIKAKCEIISPRDIIRVIKNEKLEQKNIVSPETQS